MNLRRVIIKISLLATISVGAAIALVLVLLSYLRQEKYYALAHEVKYVFCGHSHMQLAINDTIVQNAINFGEEGETYFYTLQKLEALLPANPNIEIVFLEFTNNALSRQLDERTWRKNFLLSKLPKVTPFLDEWEFTLLFKETPANTIKAYAASAELGIKFLLSDESSYPTHSKWYRYYVEKKSTLDSLLAHQNNSKTIEFLSIPSAHSIEHISKIQSLCAMHGVKLVLMRSPTHVSWAYRANESMLDSIRKAHFKGLPFLDLNDFALSTKDYRDDSHLNFNGASKLSHHVDSVLRKGDF